MSSAKQVLPARTGVAMLLGAGDQLRVVNTYGSQVVDLWAMAADDVLESMSMPHSRNPWYRLAPRPGDSLVTNLRRPILKLLEAEMGCIVALSACPHDLPPVQLNGIDCTPRDVAYAVIARG